VITLFHNPSSSTSIRAHTFLKQAAGNAQTTATIDQASDHSQQSKQERTEFDLGMCTPGSTAGAGEVLSRTRLQRQRLIMGLQQT